MQYSHSPAIHESVTNCSCIQYHLGIFNFPRKLDKNERHCSSAMHSKYRTAERKSPTPATCNLITLDDINYIYFNFFPLIHAHTHSSDSFARPYLSHPPGRVSAHKKRVYTRRARAARTDVRRAAREICIYARGFLPHRFLVCNKCSFVRCSFWFTRLPGLLSFATRGPRPPANFGAWNFYGAPPLDCVRRDLRYYHENDLW